VVLDQDVVPSHPDGFLQELHRSFRVMQDITKEHRVPRLIREWKPPSVERDDRNVRSPPDERIRPAYAQVGATLEDEPIDETIPAADVEDRVPAGYKLREVCRQRPHAP